MARPGSQQEFGGAEVLHDRDQDAEIRGPVAVDVAQHQQQPEGPGLDDPDLRPGPGEIAGAEGEGRIAGPGATSRSKMLRIIGFSGLP